MFRTQFSSRLKNNMTFTELEERLQARLGKRPDLNAMLMLVGMQELGKVRDAFTKEQKQDLMHIGTCTLLAPMGYYEYLGRDNDGWPHWKLAERLPALPLPEQENLIREQLVTYFSPSL